MVDIGLIVAPLVGVTKNTLVAGGLAGAAAGALAVDAGGVSEPPHAAAITVHSPSITAFTIFIATPFRVLCSWGPHDADYASWGVKLPDYTLPRDQERVRTRIGVQSVSIGGLARRLER